jgi:hypothetical protein
VPACLTPCALPCPEHVRAGHAKHKGTVVVRFLGASEGAYAWGTAKARTALDTIELPYADAEPLVTSGAAEALGWGAAPEGASGTPFGGRGESGVGRGREEDQGAGPETGGDGIHDGEPPARAGLDEG